MEPVQEKSFVNISVVIGAVLAIVTSITIYGLALMSVSSGNPGIGGLLLGCFLCCGLIILPGIISSKLYIQDIQKSIEIGKGALIGAVSGLAFGVVFGFMDVIWKLFDVNTTVLITEYYIMVMQNLEMSELNDAIDQMRDAQEQTSSGIGTMLLNSLVIGVINIISGLAGAAFFNKKYESKEF